jgi:hypothetical protein
VSQVHEVYDAAGGEFRGFEEKTGQGALKPVPPPAPGVVANGFVGIRHLVLDHQLPFGNHVEAQDRGLYHPVALGLSTKSRWILIASLF